MFFACFFLSEIAEGTKGVQNLIHDANVCFRNGNMQCSIRKLNSAIKLSPGCLECYRFRAKVWVTLKNYKNAIRDYSQILKIDPKKYPHVYYLRADCFTELGFYKQGIMDYTKCLKLMPKDGKVWYYRARSFALSGQFANALKDINQGLATGTHHARSLIKLREAILTGKPIPYHAPGSN